MSNKEQITLSERVKKLEESNCFQHDCHDDLLLLEARVSTLEKKQETVDIVQRRVDKIEANIVSINSTVDEIKADTKFLSDSMDEFKDKIRGEFNRFIKWVAGIILLSLFSGIIVMFLWGGNAFKVVGIKISEVENNTIRTCGEIEKDIMRLNFKVDTLNRGD